MSSADEDRSILTRAAPAADTVVAYGTHSEQIADVRYGRAGEDRPLLVFIHGGFWRPSIDRAHTGPLYEGLGLADLDPASRRRARAWIVVISALWGAVRLGDRIPAYRLNMCGRLPGLAHLPDVWRAPLTGVLPAAARQTSGRCASPGRRPHMLSR